MAIGIIILNNETKPIVKIYTEVGCMKHNPINFPETYGDGKVKIKYQDLLEICQGGPLTGYIFVNGQKIKEHRFGGPLLITSEHIYIPLYIRGFFRSGFKIARIDSCNMEISIFGSLEDIIIINRIENEYVYYFDDMKMLFEKKVNLTDGEALNS